MKKTPASSIRAASCTLGCAVLSASLWAGDGARKRWDFEADTPGAIARGFSNEVGQWEVARDGDNQVLAQKARNEDATFNVALVEGTSYKDLDLSVRMKAVEGETDRGGGLVWRAKDKKNYYICRYNPLRGASYRVYKVVDGKRTQLQVLILPEDLEWHTLRVTMKGGHIICFFDGKKSLEVDDATFPDAGRIGLWSKSDARSYFDDLTVSSTE
jgi:hypothetical protein